MRTQGWNVDRSKSWDQDEPPGSDAPFGVRIACEGDRAVVVVAGDVDPATAGWFEDAVDRGFLLAEQVVIDLSGVTFMDSTGVGALVRALRQDGRTRESLVLRAPSGQVRRLLEITSLDQVLTVEGVASDGFGRSDSRRSPG